MRLHVSKLRAPSAGVALAVIALSVALGGTAVATAPTIVNIADPAAPAHRAHVDGNGNLKASVSGVVGPAVPTTPIYGSGAIGSVGTSVAIIPSNSSTIALTRLSIDNFYDQTGGAAVHVALTKFDGTTACQPSTGFRSVGVYDVPAGTTYAEPMQSPIVLKPVNPGGVWCLVAQFAVQGDPISYFVPIVSWSGYVTAGTPPVIPGAKPSAVPPFHRGS
jgi:hypothetical protein